MESLTLSPGDLGRLRELAGRGLLFRGPDGRPIGVLVPPRTPEERARDAAEDEAAFWDEDPAETIRYARTAPRPAAEVRADMERLMFLLDLMENQGDAPAGFTAPAGSGE